MNPVGLADLVDVVRVLGLRDEQIATAAELLRLQPRAVRAAVEPEEPKPVFAPRPGRVAPPPAEPLAEAASETDPGMPVFVVEQPAERTSAPLAARSLGELLPEAAVPAPPFAGLFAPGTRRALLRGVTATRERDGDVDVEQVVAQLAGNRTLGELPLEWIETTRGEVLLLLDTGEAMDPYRADLDRLPGELARVVGHDGLKLRWFEDVPTAVLGPLDDEPVPFHLPAAHTRVLAVTTFGVRGRHAAPPEVTAAWRRLARACRRARIPLLVLTPLRRRPVNVAAVTWDRTTGVRDIRRALPR
jgi:hypothetical protein